MNTDSRHDHALSAYRARIAAHFATCRDDGCTWCGDEAEDRKWEKEGI